MAKSPLEILTDGLTAGALAHSEQVTGIPFFQMQQARKEKDKVRQDTRAANRSRIDAAVRTGLVTAADVDAAGGRDALIQDPAFDNIFNGLVETTRRGLAEAKDDETKRQAALLGAIELGVSGDLGSMNTEELLMVTSSHIQEQDAAAREDTNVTVHGNAAQERLTALLDTPNPTDKDWVEAGQIATDFNNYVTTRAPKSKVGAPFVGQIAGVARTVQQKLKHKQDTNAIARDMHTGGSTMFESYAMADPLVRQSSRELGDVRVALNTLDQKLGLLSDIRQSPELQDVLSQDPELAEAIRLTKALPDGALDGEAIINEDTGLAQHIHDLPIEGLERKVARARVVAHDLPPATEQLEKKFETAASQLPPGTILHTLFANTKADSLLGVVESEGKFGISLTNPQLDPVNVALTIGLNEQVDDSTRLDILEELRRPAIGQVQVDDATRQQAEKAYQDIQGRQSIQEFEARELHRADLASQRVSGIIRAGVKHSGTATLTKNVEQGTVRDFVLPAVTGVAPAASIREQADAKQREWLAAQNPEAQAKLKREFEALSLQAEEASGREAVAATMSSTLTTLYSGNFKDNADLGAQITAIIRAELGKGPQGTTFQPGQPVPGEQIFLDALANAPDDIGFDELESAVMAYVVAANGSQINAKVVVESFQDLIDDTEGEIQDSHLVSSLDSAQRFFQQFSTKQGGISSPLGKKTKGDIEAMRRRAALTLLDVHTIR